MKSILLFLLLILLSIGLSGCATIDAVLPAEKTDKVDLINPDEELLRNKIEKASSTRKSPINPNYYYVTRYDPMEYIYCGKDLELYNLNTSESMMKEFPTLQMAEKHYPRHKLRKPCDEIKLDPDLLDNLQ